MAERDPATGKFPKGRGAGHGGPARGLRRFEKGHKLSTVHGARTADVPVLAREMAEEILERVNHIEESDQTALIDFCIAQIRVWRLASYIEREGELDDDGNPRHALKSLREWLGTTERLRSKIGFDPVSRASLVMTAARTRVVGEALQQHVEQKYGTP